MTIQIGDGTLFDVWAATGQVVEPDLTKTDQGWTLGERPPHEFMNFTQNLYGQKLNYLLRNGVAEWNAAKDYTTGSVVQSGNTLWVAILGNTNSLPATNNTNWKRATELIDLGLTATPAELNRTAGVTAPIQGQLDSKVPDTRSITVTDGLLGGGTLDGDLTISGREFTATTWDEGTNANPAVISPLQLANTIAARAPDDQGYDFVFGASNYTRFPNGLLIQYGFTPPQAGPQQVVLPISYGNFFPYGVLATVARTGSLEGNSTAYGAPVAPGTIDITLDRDSNESVDQIFWMTIGV